MAAFPARDHDAFTAHWAKTLADETNITRSVLLNGEVAGNLGSWLADDGREVGYWLGREFWGKGVATAALAAFLREIDERPLLAHVASHNVGSIRVLRSAASPERAARSGRRRYRGARPGASNEAGRMTTELGQSASRYVTSVRQRPGSCSVSGSVR